MGRVVNSKTLGVKVQLPTNWQSQRPLSSSSFSFCCTIFFLPFFFFFLLSSRFSSLTQIELFPSSYWSDLYHSITLSGRSFSLVIIHHEIHHSRNHIIKRILLHLPKARSTRQAHTLESLPDLSKRERELSLLWSSSNPIQLRFAFFPDRLVLGRIFIDNSRMTFSERGPIPIRPLRARKEALNSPESSTFAAVGFWVCGQFLNQIRNFGNQIRSRRVHSYSLETNQNIGLITDSISSRKTWGCYQIGK